jgi:L-threonylcarbamoyladenylate synthase
MGMKLLTATGTSLDTSTYATLIEVLENNGIICFPAENNYRLGASALSHDAVSALIAAKRRSSHAPSLVFVSGLAMLKQIAEPLPMLGQELADQFWPGPLTLLVKPSEYFPAKVRKAISKATGMIGVRIPGHPIARGIVEAFGKPILVSSANLAKKKGASSPAQVRKNFGRQVEAMIDLGDLPSGSPSTLVDLSGESIQIKRQGAISEDQIRQVAERMAG